MSIAVPCPLPFRLLLSYPCHPVAIDALLLLALAFAAAAIYLHRTADDRERLLQAAIVVSILFVLPPLFAAPLEIQGGSRLPAAEMTDVVCQARNDTVYANVRVFGAEYAVMNVSAARQNRSARPVLDWSETNTSTEIQRSFAIQPAQDLVAGQRYVVSVSFEEMTVQGTCRP